MVKIKWGFLKLLTITYVKVLVIVFMLFAISLYVVHEQTHVAQIMLDDRVEYPQVFYFPDECDGEGAACVKSVWTKGVSFDGKLDWNSKSETRELQAYTIQYAFFLIGLLVMPWRRLVFENIL